jgi:hypothetical protein
MARKRMVEIYHANDDGCGDWKIDARVWFGSPGSYEDPPEGDEVELLVATEDLGKRLGPPEVVDFETWAERNELTPGDIQELEDKAINAAHEDY